MRPRRLLGVVGIVALLSSVLIVWGSTPPRPPADAPATAASSLSPTELKLDQVLPEVHFDRVPFEQAVEWFRKTTGANFFVTWRSLHDGGIEKTTPVSLHLRDVTAAKALATLCDAVMEEGATEVVDFTVHENVVVVTTGGRIERYTYARTYDIRDLLADPPAIPVFSEAPTFGSGSAATTSAPSPPQPRGATADDSTTRTRQELVDEIVRLIMETSSPDTWVDNGGRTGVIREFAGMLVVIQTSENHRQIRNLLYQLRHPERPEPTRSAADAAPDAARPRE